MPEGPEIRRAADQLEQAVKNQILTDVWFAFPELQTYQQMLVGERVKDIETRGKALLIHFSNGLTMYSHNQLYGIWRVVKTGEMPETGRSLRVRLATAEQTLLLYSASDIQLLNEETLAQHPFLLKVGPDVLDMTLTPQDIKARLLSKRFCRRQLGTLLLDQAFLAGLGNYLRAEILWQAGISPWHKAVELSDEQLTALSAAMLAVPRLSYQTRGQQNRRHHHGAKFRFRVFNRAGEDCEHCSGVIEKTTLSSRPLYWCPGCQK